MSENLLAKHVQKTLEWVNQLNGLLEWNSQNYALDALRAVLHQLRDHLPITEAANLGAQLPLLIRGIYFENWRPSQTPVKERQKDQFIEAVRDTLEQYIRKSFEDEDIEFIIKSVFQVLANHVDEGESVKLVKVLPTHLKGFIAGAILE